MRTLQILILITGLGAFAASAEEARHLSTNEKLSANAAEVAAEAYALALKSWQSGQNDAEHVYLWSQRWADAQISIVKESDESTQALRDHFVRMKSLEAEAKKRFQQGEIGEFELKSVQWFSIMAQLQWANNGKLTQTQVTLNEMARDIEDLRRLLNSHNTGITPAVRGLDLRQTVVRPAQEVDRASKKVDDRKAVREDDF